VRARRRRRILSALHASSIADDEEAARPYAPPSIGGMARVVGSVASGGG
jgi:hypothetical protein